MAAPIGFDSTSAVLKVEADTRSPRCKEIEEKLYICAHDRIVGRVTDESVQKISQPLFQELFTEFWGDEKVAKEALAKAETVESTVLFAQAQQCEKTYGELEQIFNKLDSEENHKNFQDAGNH